MPLTITKITGIGGIPPTHIRVEGTITGCEIMQVSSSCTDTPVSIPIPTGGFHQWSIDLPNDKNCTCGSSISVSAWCSLGDPSSDIRDKVFTLNCDDCPLITIKADPPEECVNGKRKVTYHAAISGMSPVGTVVLQWAFPNGSPVSPTATTAFVVASNGTLPSQSVEYYATNLSGPVTQTAILQIILPVNCPPVSINVSIEPCPTCCPQVTVTPSATGIAPISAVASFVAKLTWPTGCLPIIPSSYQWTLNGPSGKSYQRSTAQPTTDTTTPWLELASGNPSIVQFMSGGNYSISVTAIIPGIILPCNPTDTQTFTIVGEPPSPPPSPPPPQGGGFNFCAGMLLTAISMLIIGSLLLVLGICLKIVWLIIAGAIVVGIGLLLYVFWIWCCSRFTSCTLMRTVHCVLFWIVAVVGPAIAILSALSGDLPCMWATALTWGGWGTLYAWLGSVMRSVRCSTTC